MKPSEYLRDAQDAPGSIAANDPDINCGRNSGVLMCLQPEDENSLQVVVPDLNDPVFDCIAGVCASYDSCVAMLVDKWDSSCGKPLRCVFKDRNGSLFATTFPDSVRGDKSLLAPGCVVELTDFTAFTRLHPNKVNVVTTEFVVLAFQVKKEPMEGFAMRPFVHQFAFGPNVLNLAYLTGECIMVNSTVWQEELENEGEVAYVFRQHLDEDQVHGQVDADDPTVYHMRAKVPSSCGRSVENVRKTLDINQPDGCECLQKYGVVGCLAKHLPPNRVVSIQGRLKPDTHKIYGWRADSFYEFYSRVLQEPDIPTNKERQASCLVKDISSFVLETLGTKNRTNGHEKKRKNGSDETV